MKCLQCDDWAQYFLFDFKVRDNRNGSPVGMVEVVPCRPRNDEGDPDE